MEESIQSSQKYYLPKKTTSKKTLVLDLDETLVHSQFVPFSIKSDVILKIDIDDHIYDIHVLIRPGVEEFIQKMSELYEIVIFTASVSKYADPLLDIIDKDHVCACRLFREHCCMVGITYIKDLQKLGRNLKDTIIVDNSPISYSYNYENGIPILTWFNNKSDRELYNLIPILEFLSNVDDVRDYIKQIVVNDTISYDNVIKVIEDYYKNETIINNKIINEILDNQNNSLENQDNNNYIYSNDVNDNQIMIDNEPRMQNNKNNLINITIENNSINNYLYFSPLYENGKLGKENIDKNKTISNMKDISSNVTLKAKQRAIKGKNFILPTKINIQKGKGFLKKNNKSKNKKDKKKKINLIEEKINSINNTINKSITNYIKKMNNSDIKEEYKTVISKKNGNR